MLASQIIRYTVRKEIETMSYGWTEFFAEEASKPYWLALQAFLAAERVAGPVYPPEADVYRAMALTPLNEVKVVILGQDPYHQPGQAMGLAFSTDDTKMCRPPSLNNIIKELRNDIDPWAALAHGNLTPWTRQGVLLLNTALTVRHGQPESHLVQWRPFTATILRAVVERADAFPHVIVWGKKAQGIVREALGTWKQEFPVEFPWLLRGSSANFTATFSPHPSPYSANSGFFGSRPFSRANEALALMNPGRDVRVDWRLG